MIATSNSKIYAKFHNIRVFRVSSSKSLLCQNTLSDAENEFPCGYCFIRPNKRLRYHLYSTVNYMSQPTFFNLKDTNALLGSFYVTKNRQCDGLNTLPSCDILMSYRRMQDTLGFDFQFSSVSR
jgi:hypothetical protein